MRVWKFSKDEDGRRHIKEEGQLGSLMCDEKYYPWTPDDDEAWLMMAASPDLLAACKAAENWLSEYEDGPDSGVAGLLAQLRNAIKGAGV